MYHLLILNNLTDEETTYDLSQYVIKNKVLTNGQEHMTNKKLLYLKPYGSIVLEVEEII
jgi:hypothetical protein